jgi:hypothetical protein
MRNRQGTDRRPVAVVLMADGRRVHVPVQAAGLVDLSVGGLFRSFVVGVLSLVELIAGSRRENGGTRRNERN